MNLAFFEKIWLFLSTLVLATSGCKTVSSVFFQQNLDHHKSEISSVKVLPVQEWSKRTKFSQKNAKFMLTLMSKEKLNFLFQIQILTFKYVWNLPSLSLARFFLIQNELRPGCLISLVGEIGGIIGITLGASTLTFFDSLFQHLHYY